MAWASKKQYAIMMSSEEGKNLAEKMPDLSQNDFSNEFAKLLGQSGTKEAENEETEEKKPDDEEKYVFSISPKQDEEVRKKFKYVFRKADKEDFEFFLDNLHSCGENIIVDLYFLHGLMKEK